MLRPRIVIVTLVWIATGVGQSQESNQTVKGEPLTSQPTGSRDGDPARMVQEAMDRLKTEGLTGFLNVAFSGRKGAIPLSERANAEAFFTTVRNNVMAANGKPLGEIEFVRMDVVGRSGVRYVFVERMERTAMVWSLDFYRIEGNEWKWTGIRATNTNTELEPEFRAATQVDAAKGAFELASRGVEALKTNSMSKLLDEVIDPARSVISAERSQFEQKLDAVRQNSLSQLGKPLSELELVRTEAIGQSLFRISYLERFEKGAMVWKFVFYRTPDGWKWQNLTSNEWSKELGAR